MEIIVPVMRMITLGPALLQEKKTERGLRKKEDHFFIAGIHFSAPYSTLTLVIFND